MLKVIRAFGKKWVCQCYCGKEVIYSAGYLRCRQKKQKALQTCGCGCYKKGNKSPMWKGYGEISARFWHGIKGNAIKRGHIMSISIEDAWELFLKQDRRCKLSGEILCFQTKSHDTGTASLDRIDSTKGYVIDNVQWVHKTINSMKWDLTRDRFIYLCKVISSPLEPVNSIKDELTKQHPNWRGYGGISMNFWYRYPSGAESRGISFDLSIKDAWDLFRKQNGCCAITGIPINLWKRKGDISTASLDRIDNTKGYHIDNVQWVHVDINVKLRRNLNMMELLAWSSKVAKFANQ